MTTTVTITSKNPNHENVLVVQRAPATGRVLSSIVLTDGDETTVYLHSGAEVLLQEEPNPVSMAEVG